MANTKYKLRYLPLFYKDLEEKIVYIAEELHNEKQSETGSFSENLPTPSKIKELIDNGDFVSDELIFELLENKINSLDGVNGIIFDGVPRTLEQVHMLDKLIKIDYVIY